MARVNKLVQEVVADQLERLRQDDERLGMVSVTYVQVDPDLRRAVVLLSSLPEEVEVALHEHRVRLQAAISRQVRLKRVPQLSFMADRGVESGARVEEILRGLPESRGPRHVEH
jgi:ribosome-binding factor A